MKQKRNCFFLEKRNKTELWEKSTSGIMRRNRHACAPSLPKRQKPTANADSVIQNAATASAPATASLISKEVMAATRLQRVWRSTFAHLLTRQFAVELLKPEVGVSIEYIKSIRSIFYGLLLLE